MRDKLPKKIAFVVYYNKINKYSFNALISALDNEKELDDIIVYFISTKEELLKELVYITETYDEIILGVSFFTTQLWEISRLIKTIRKNFGNKILCIAGGPHPSGDPKGTLKMGFNVVFTGESEETLIEFLKKIKNKENYHNIKGLAYISKNNKYHYTGKRNLIDLDKFPPFPVKYNKFGAIEITRGCPYLCSFCQTPFILGITPRHRSIDYICKYVKLMKSKNLTDIRFITPNAFSYGSKDGKTLNLTKLEDLLRKIKRIIQPEGRIFFGSFPSEVRPEHVNDSTLDLILNYASNDNIIIGAQSGSQKILNFCHRGHTVEDIHNAVELTLSKKLKANVDFIFGLPGETEEDIRLTINMMKDLSNRGAKIHTHSFIPLPHTPFAKKKVSKIDEEVKGAINELTSKGYAFGEWKKQEKLALKIEKYFKTGNLD